MLVTVGKLGFSDVELTQSFFSQGRGNFKKRPSRVSTVMHHAYLNVTGFMCNIDEKCQVFFSIYDAREGRFIRCVLSRKFARNQVFYHPNMAN